MSAQPQLVELPFTPRPWQKRVHDERVAAKARYSVVVAHRRWGKTVWACRTLLHEALLERRWRPQYAYLAPLLKQAKSIAWDYMMAMTQPIPGRTVNASELSIGLPNGATIRLHGGDNPDALRGIYLDGVVIDETAQIKPELWQAVLRPALSDRHGWVVFLGTPYGIDLLHDVYSTALGTPGWYSTLIDGETSGAISADELADLRRTLPGPMYAREIRCDFNASALDTLISTPAVRAAMERDLSEREYEFAPRVLGVDVARYGGDLTVLQPRQGRMAFAPSTLPGWGNMEVAGRVSMMIERWRPDAVFIDAGRGEGVIDRLRQMRHEVIEVPFGGSPDDEVYANKRAEMWWRMAAWIESGGAVLPSVPRLAAELCALQYTWSNATGKRSVEAKVDVKQRLGYSPDYADALALTFAQDSVVPGRVWRGPEAYLAEGRTEAEWRLERRGQRAEFAKMMEVN